MPTSVSSTSEFAWGVKMKLSAICCTYLRPHLLGELIESFLRQDYPRELRELIILDDAGQYDHQTGDGWELISIPRRFRTLGEKRNATAGLASADTEGFLVADDDDIYLPHWFSTQAEALRRAEWSRPGIVLVEHEDRLRTTRTRGKYHGGWAVRRDAFYRVCGYGPLQCGEDRELATSMQTVGISQCDPSEFAEPFYLYRWNNGSYHIGLTPGDDSYRRLAPAEPVRKQQLAIGWSRDYSRISVLPGV